MPQQLVLNSGILPQSKRKDVKMIYSVNGNIEMNTSGAEIHLTLPALGGVILEGKL
ncbi:MAG: hypothetical protein WAN36_13170 [Calditrichia bacterium]